MRRKEMGSEFTAIFRVRGREMVLNGDRDGLKRPYAELTAQACLRDEQAASDRHACEPRFKCIRFPVFGERR